MMLKLRLRRGLLLLAVYPVTVNRIVSYGPSIPLHRLQQNRSS